LPITGTPAASSASISESSAAGIDHQAVADNGLFSGPQDSARNQLQNEFPVADEHRVAGIMPALIARDDVEPAGE
jgi:hypothetical protein